MQPRKLKSKWQLKGGFKGGDETSKVEKIGKKGDKKESEESSSDEEETSSSDKDEGSSDKEVSSSDEEATRRGFGTDDEELNYGNAGPFLSDLFEEERRGTVLDDVEEKELSLPCQKPMDVSDEVDSICEERTMEVDDSDKEATRRGFGTDDEELNYGSAGPDLSDLLEEERRRAVLDDIEEKELPLPCQTPMDVSDEVDFVCEERTMEVDDCEGKDLDDVPDDDEANEEWKAVKSGAWFLSKIDKDYLCSPRLVVRGQYSSEVLKIIVKRRTEGNLVDWGIINKKTKKQLLLVHCEMTYPFGLSREALSTKFGHEVWGGWKWHGWGYGYLNLFLPSDPRVLHIDIQEAVFYGEDIFTHYHLSGRGCRNVNKSEDVMCKEEGCGVRIWSIKFSSFTTKEEQREYYQPRTFTKEKEERTIYLSLFAFFNGDFQIALHRDPELKKLSEVVAWFKKDDNANFDDSVARVDRLKLQKAKQIWATRVPKIVVGGDTLTAGSDGAQGDEMLDGDGGGSSWQDSYEKCFICQRSGFIAFHLRQSQGCLRQLRAKRQFQISKGSDEQYIIKFALLAGECPSPVCATGRHSVLPEGCFDWWIADGWDILGWRGRKEEADPELVNMKISNFLKNHKSRSDAQELSEADSDTGALSTAADLGGGEGEKKGGNGASSTTATDGDGKSSGRLVAQSRDDGETMMAEVSQLNL